MKKAAAILISAVVLVPLFTFGLYSMADTDATVSEAEKRTLKTKPEFSAASLFSGRYCRELSEYYADTFPLRDSLVNLSARMKGFYAYQGSSDSGSLIISKTEDFGEGETILDFLEPDDTVADDVPEPSPSPPELSPSASPSLEASPVPTPPPTPSPSPTPSPTPTPTPVVNPDDVQKAGGSIIVVGNRVMEITHSNAKATDGYAAAINLAQEKMPNARVISLAAPNSAEFYSSEEFHTASYSQKDVIQYAYDNMKDIVTVDAYDKISRHTDEYIYFRTDHHWQALGAYYAYTAFCESLYLQPVPLSDFKSGEHTGFVGSFYTFLSAYPAKDVLKENPDTLTYYLPIYETKMQIFTSGPAMTDPLNYPLIGTKMSAANKYICFIGGDNAMTYIHSDVNNGRSIIVVKESFGNAFVPFLTSHYEHIYVTDPRKVNGNNQPKLNLPSFVEEQGIEDVLFINYSIALTSTGITNLINKALE